MVESKTSDTYSFLKRIFHIFFFGLESPSHVIDAFVNVHIIFIVVAFIRSNTLLLTTITASTMMTTSTITTDVKFVHDISLSHVLSLFTYSSLSVFRKMAAGHFGFLGVCVCLCPTCQHQCSHCVHGQGRQLHGHCPDNKHNLWCFFGLVGI